QVDAQAERLADRSIVEEQAGQARRIERATAATDDGLAGAEDIPGKADARREVVEIGMLTGVRKADAIEGIADEEKSGRGAGNYSGVHAGSIRVRPELFRAAVDFLHHALRFIAQAQRQCESRPNLPGILEVEAEDVLTRVGEIAGS